MAQLNSSNVVNGNIVEPNDILQLYDAFTAGGGTTGAYNVSISGSLTGSATTALNASKLDPTLNASTNAEYNVLFAATSSATYETIFKENGSIMTYNPSTNVLKVTASRASSAIVADSATLASSALTLSGQQISTPAAGPTDVSLSMIAGSVKMAGGNGGSANFPALVGKTLGTNCFVTATVYSPTPVGTVVNVRSLGGAGNISFYTVSGSGTEDIFFNVMYVP
jgi:hypothetical protein